MPFCSNCGAEIIEGAKFCQECGAPISAQAEQYLGKRQQEYSGKIYKCPNCGEILNSFEATCPACGYELRGAQASNSIQKLAEEINRLEFERALFDDGKKKHSLLSSKNLLDFIARARENSSENSKVSLTDKRIANLIKTFPVPNTKEDVLEFMILASANIDTNVLDSSSASIKDQEGQRLISDAWVSKLEQVYQKAKITFGDTSDFQEIENLYNCRQKQIKRGRNKSTRETILAFGIIALIFVGTFIGINIGDKNEQTRMEHLVGEIEVALENGEYELAMMNALSIEFKGGSTTSKEKWLIQRTYWIEKILEEAATHGVDLEYMIPEETEPPQESEPPEETSPQGFFSGFIQGFQNALNPSPSPSN